MSRVFGTFNIDANYDLSVKKPFDARMLVPTYADLTTKSNWYQANTANFNAYNGMIVAVADKNDIVNSGIYMLFDPSGAKNANVEDVNNWHKLAELSDLSNFTEKLTAVEKALNGFGKGDNYVAGLISKVDSNTDAIANITSDYVKASELSGEIEAVLTTSLQDYVTVTDFNPVKTKVEENTAKLNGINTTVTDAIADAISNLTALEVSVATPETIGGIKSASGENQVSVAADGTASVQKINISSLVQNDGDVLILNGGNDGDPDDTEE